MASASVIDEVLLLDDIEKGVVALTKIWAVKDG
jgi:hypothetical protein